MDSNEKNKSTFKAPTQGLCNNLKQNCKILNSQTSANVFLRRLSWNLKIDIIMHVSGVPFKAARGSEVKE
jgi:hypothetical protein